MNMEKNENKHNPRIVIAMDSFKGCLSSIEAGLAVKAGLERTLSDAYAEVFRISDGGEGLVDALAGSIGGEPGTDSGEGVPFISFKIMVLLLVFTIILMVLQIQTINCTSNNPKASSK